MPAGGLSFGAAVHPHAIIDQPAQFDFYDGGGLDFAALGAAQIDARGNVNVSKIGSRVVGVGGFVNLTMASRKVVFLTTFTETKQLSVAYEEQKLRITSEGKIKKFIRRIDQISFSGKLAIEEQREILYVTERCVFRLTPEGLLLSEIAPGIDVQRDIFDQMEFKPCVAENLQTMSADYFRI